MSQLVGIQQLLRQHGESAKVTPGVGWEKRVASLERMRAAMKNSQWGALSHHSGMQVGASRPKTGKQMGAVATVMKKRATAGKLSPGLIANRPQV
jgi:hypothetical protein